MQSDHPYATASRAQRAALKAKGGKPVTVQLTPAAVAALRELRARGAASDASAVNAAIIGQATALREAERG